MRQANTKKHARTSSNDLLECTSNQRKRKKKNSNKKPMSELGSAHHFCAKRSPRKLPRNIILVETIIQRYCHGKSWNTRLVKQDWEETCEIIWLLWIISWLKKLCDSTIQNKNTSQKQQTQCKIWWHKWETQSQWMHIYSMLTTNLLILILHIIERWVYLAKFPCTNKIALQVWFHRILDIMKYTKKQTKPYKNKLTIKF